MAPTDRSTSPTPTDNGTNPLDPRNVLPPTLFTGVDNKSGTRPPVNYPEGYDPELQESTDQALDAIWKALGGNSTAAPGDGKPDPEGDNSDTPGEGQYTVSAEEAKRRAENARTTMTETNKQIEAILAEAATQQEATKDAVKQIIADLNDDIETLKPVLDTATGQDQLRTRITETLKRGQAAVHEAVEDAKKKGNSMGNDDAPGANKGSDNSNSNSPGAVTGDNKSGDNGSDGDKGVTNNTGSRSGDDEGDDDGKKKSVDDPASYLNGLNNGLNSGLGGLNSGLGGLNNGLGGLGGLNNGLGNNGLTGLNNGLGNPGLNSPSDLGRVTPLDTTATPTNTTPVANTPAPDNNVTPIADQDKGDDDKGDDDKGDDDKGDDKDKDKPSEKDQANKPEGDPRHQAHAPAHHPGDTTVKLPDGSSSEAPNDQAAQAARNALADKGGAGDAARNAYAGTGVEMPSDGKDLGRPVEDPADLRAGDVIQWSDHTRVVVGPGLVAVDGEVKTLDEVMNGSDAGDFKGFYRPTESATDPMLPPDAPDDPTSGPNTQQQPDPTTNSNDQDNPTPKSNPTPKDHPPVPPAGQNPNLSTTPNNQASWSPTPWDRTSA